jgi:hypothetical protein
MLSLGLLSLACTSDSVKLGDSGQSDTGGDSNTDTGSPDKEAKALLVFIDGFIPEGINTSETPTLDLLLAESAWSLTARAESTTISGSRKEPLSSIFWATAAKSVKPGVALMLIPTFITRLPPVRIFNRLNQ